MDKYVKLAKETVEEYIKNKKIIKAPENLPAEFYSRRAGIFVTIFKDEQGISPRDERQRILRGCVGTFLPTKKNIAEEIVNNAVSACSSDYRFTPITVEELPELNYEVSILSQPEPVEDINNHNPKENGVIVRCDDGRSGLLLPDLDGIDTADQQVYVACQKGGIDPNSDNYKLYCFTVEKHI